MADNAGGAAFPTTAGEAVFKRELGWHASPGMTLRDWFAGQALAGILANSNPVMLRTAKSEAEQRGETNTAQTFSRQAYEYADALLAHRENKP